MEKDATIIKLLSKLELDVFFEEIRLVDYWEADYCAIGFEFKNKLMYVNTFNYLAESNEKYDYDLEITEHEESITIKEVRGVSYQQLKVAFLEFFG